LLDTRYCIDPTGFCGNGIFEFINDYRRDVRRVDCVAANPLQRQNVGWLAIQRGPEPHMFVYTVRRIRAGDRVYLDYGRDYFTSRFDQL
jgi:hypothetical protein